MVKSNVQRWWRPVFDYGIVVDLAPIFDGCQNTVLESFDSYVGDDINTDVEIRGFYVGGGVSTDLEIKYFYDGADIITVVESSLSKTLITLATTSKQ